MLLDRNLTARGKASAIVTSPTGREEAPGFLVGSDLGMPAVQPR